MDFIGDVFIAMLVKSVKKTSDPSLSSLFAQQGPLKGAYEGPSPEFQQENPRKAYKLGSKISRFHVNFTGQNGGP